MYRPCCGIWNQESKHHDSTERPNGHAGIAEKTNWQFDREERAFIAGLTAEVRESLDQIVAEADTEALKNALLAILLVVLLALLGSVLLSPQPQAATD